MASSTRPAASSSSIPQLSRELGHQAVSGLAVHRGLRRSELPLVLAAREIPHHLGTGEDVAAAQLLLVVLEPPRPVGRHPSIADRQHLQHLFGFLGRHGVTHAELFEPVLGHSEREVVGANRAGDRQDEIGGGLTIDDPMLVADHIGHPVHRVQHPTTDSERRSRTRRLGGGLGRLHGCGGDRRDGSSTRKAEASGLHEATV